MNGYWDKPSMLIVNFEPDFKKQVSLGKAMMM
jgi:hypothetical protein